MTITFLKTSKTIWNNLDEITADFYMNFLLIKLPNISKNLKRIEINRVIFGINTY